MKKNIALLVSSIIFSLVLSEILLRVFVADGVIPTSVADEELGTLRRKNLNYIHYDSESDSRPIPVSINSFGFRDKEWQLDDDSFKIMVIGDSFVEAMQVATEERFTELLEQKFKENNYDVSVYNIGISDRGPDGYLLYLKKFYPIIEPDIVVISLYNGNDFKDVNYRTNPAKGEVNYIVVDGEVVAYKQIASVAEKLMWKIKIPLSRLHLAQITNKAIDLKFKHRQRRKSPKVAPLHCRIGDANADDSFLIVEKLFEEIKSIAGDGLVVMQIPNKDETNDNCDTPEKFMRTVASDNNIALLQLLPLMGENIKEYYWRHLNYAGHAFVAETLFDYLEPIVLSK